MEGDTDANTAKGGNGGAEDGGNGIIGALVVATLHSTRVQQLQMEEPR